VIALGTRVHHYGRDFAAVYGRGAAVVVELAGAAYGRLVVSAANAEAVAPAVGAPAGQA
jgi:hypothetical protein